MIVTIEGKKAEERECEIQTHDEYTMFRKVTKTQDIECCDEEGVKDGRIGKLELGETDLYHQKADSISGKEAF